MAAPQIPGTPPPGQLGRDNLARQSGVTGVNQIGQDVYQIQFANGLKTNLRGDAGRKAFEQYSGGAPPPPKDAEGNRVGASVGPAPTAPAPTQAPPQPPNGPLPHTAEGIDPATQKKFVGQAIMKDGQLMVYRPGSRGSPGGVTPLGQQVLASRAAADQAATPLERDAADEQRIGQLSDRIALEKQKEAVANQQIQALNAQKNKENEARDAEKHVADLRARADAAMEEYTSSRPPERSTEESIMSGIAAGLGALGAALARTPNFAESFLNQLAANKMRKWEAEVALKGKKADNLLAKQLEALGDMKLAKASVEEIILKRAALDEEQAALATGSEKLRNTHQQMASAAAAAAIRSNQKLNEAALVDFQTNKLFNRPAVAGSTGALLPVTQESYEKGRESERQNRELLVREREQATGGTKNLGSLDTGRTEKIASYGNAAAAAVAVMDELKNRKVQDDTTDDPTTGLYDRATNRQSVEGLNQNTTALAKGLQSAFGKSDRDAEDALQMATGGGSGRDRYQAAERAEEKLIGNLRTELATLPPEHQQQMLNTLPPQVAARVLGKK